MSIRQKPYVFTIVILLFCSFAISANPLLGGSGDDAPEVRPPSSGGFMVETQLRFREMLGESLTSLEEGKDPTLYFTILGAAFVYGLLHAAGPGHRKTVIFSMFLTRKARWSEPLLAAFVAAAVHGGTAVILILIFQLVFNSLRAVEIQNISSWLEGISYSILLALALWFFLRAIGELTGRREHRHGGHEGNHHRGNIYATLAASSLFPCPGVIMIMTFSAALGILKTGILAVISLSAGMGITISVAAYLAYFGREGLFGLLKEKEHLIGKVTTMLEMGSYGFLLLFSLWMILPFYQSLLVS